MGNVDRAIFLKQIDRLYRDGTFNDQSDGQLLDRYLKYRDEGAFEALVNLHGPMVLSLCRRLLRDPRDIEDAFQATFLVLAQKAGSIRNRDVLSSWLYGVAYRVAVRARSDVMRRRSLETGVPLLDELAGTATPEVDESGFLLDQELSRLPEKYRAPIVLCYLKEQTHDQAAAALSWPVGTVRSRLARGRALLQERLTRRGCKPATALLAASPGASMRSLTTAVPQPLVQATVAAAGRVLGGTMAGGPAAWLTLFRSGSSPLCGSASTLAQGVLTTMAFTQVKFIASGLAAAGLLAGGLTAGAFALGSSGRGQKDAPPGSPQKTVVRTAPEARPPAAKTDVRPPGPPTGAPGMEARLTELERKLDLLLQRLAPQGQVPIPQLRMNGGPNVPPPPQGLPLEPRPPQDAVQAVPVPERTPSLETPEVLQAEHPSGLRVPPSPTQPPAPPDLAPLNPLAPPQPTADFLPDAQPQTHTDRSPAAPPQQPLDRMPDAPPQPPAGQPEAPPADVPPSRSADRPMSTPEPFKGLSQEELLKLISELSGKRNAAGAGLSGYPSLKETEAEIQFALEQFLRNKLLFENKAIDYGTYQQSLGRIGLLAARLEGMDEELADEWMRLKTELARKQAEMKAAEAQRDSKVRIAASTKKLLERKVIIQDEYARTEDDVQVAEARVMIQRTEVQSTELRMSQIERMRQTIAHDLNGLLRTVPELKQGNKFPAPKAGNQQTPPGNSGRQTS